MTKFLVKAKKGCTFVSTNGNGEFLDEYRYRVFSNASDIREWDSRKSIDIYGQLRDDASEDKLKEYLKDGESGLEKFYKDFANDSKKFVAPAPEPIAAPIVEEVETEVEAPAPKKRRHSKR